MESETEKETTKRDEYFEAIENKDVERVKVILQRSGSDALNKYFDDFGYSGLHNAAENGILKIVQVLLEKGTQVDIPDIENKSTPLHLAAKGGHLEVVQLLLDKGAKLGARDSSQCQPIHYAAKNGKLETLKELISRGADVNVRDEYGWTPLHFAFANGHVQCGQLLIDSKAQITKDDNGRSPIDVAAEKKMENIIEAFKNL